MSQEELMPITHQMSREIAAAAQMRNALIQFRKTVLIQGQDFGTIPGVKKPSLFKPGAEKLLNLFKLSHEIETTDKVIDLKEGFVSYSYKCTISNPREKNRSLGQCEGSSNTYEVKYRYVWQRLEAWPEKSVYDQMIAEGTGKFQQNSKTNKYDFFIRKPNPDTISYQNTIQKMAQKRALVGAVLIATGASEFFTQDVEDMVFIDVEDTVLEPKDEELPPPAPEPAEMPPAPPIEPPASIPAPPKEDIVTVGLEFYTMPLKTAILNAESKKKLKALFLGNPKLHKNQKFLDALKERENYFNSQISK